MSVTRGDALRFASRLPLAVIFRAVGALLPTFEAKPTTVQVIDTTTNTVTAAKPVVLGPGRIDITPDGAFAYVANSFFNLVSMIDIATNTVIATVAVVTPVGIASTPNGAFVYVTNRDSNTVSVIDTTTNIVVAIIRVGDSPFAIAFPTRGR
ncbi:MAG TPA: beta-propeller fold lactonase family protein [Pyrinomonadaceae bacterium]|nr:beta-propeller fold lactonase family protein [Pyrinomonadaceae bacterium]